MLQNRTKDIRLQELKEMLIQRDYKESLIENAIRKAKAISRDQALKHVARSQTTMRPVYVVSYDPMLRDIPKILNKHWRSTCVTDQYFKEVFPDPPMTAFKRQRNIKSFMIRAKVSQEKISDQVENILG